MLGGPTQLYGKGQPAAQLSGVSGAAAGLRLALSGQPVTIGRDPSCNLVLNDNMVSRRHVSLEPSGEGWLLTDLNAANGTFVNGKRITRQLLAPGDQLMVGQSVLVFQVEQPSAQATYTPPQPPGNVYTGPTAMYPAVIPPGQRPPVQQPPLQQQPYPRQQPPAQPPVYQQPGYQQPPPQGYPPQPGYQPPAYQPPPQNYPQQPVNQQPPGYPPPAYQQPYPPQAYPPAPKKKSGCGCWIGGCLVALLLLGLSAGGLYFAYAQGYLTLNNVLALVGMGPARVQVSNLMDSTAYVSINPVSEEEGGYARTGTAASLDFLSYNIDPAGTYDIFFGSSEGSSDLGVCRINLKGGMQLQFVLLPEKVIVNQEGRPPQNGQEFLISASPLCQR